jgi:molecular chaperone DnaK (HSP70)
MEQYRVKLGERGELQIQSSEKLSPQEIQPLIDSSRLSQKAYYQHQKELESQQQFYTLILSGLVVLGLFTVSFAAVRTVSKTLIKAEVIRYVG